jgi:hypothetical protein
VENSEGKIRKGKFGRGNAEGEMLEREIRHGVLFREAQKLIFGKEISQERNLSPWGVTKMHPLGRGAKRVKH